MTEETAHRRGAPTPDDVVAGLLPTVRTVAVVGISDQFTRPSFRLAAYLLDLTSWEVTLVNPHVVEVLNRIVSPTLPDAPDLVVIFRRSEALPEMLADAAAAGARAVWLPGETSEPDAPMTVVVGRSLKDDHKAYGR